MTVESRFEDTTTEPVQMSGAQFFAAISEAKARSIEEVRLSGWDWEKGCYPADSKQTQKESE